MNHGFLSAPFPIDCAICPLPDTVWETRQTAASIPERVITWAHVPVAREILFFRGYAQEDSHFHFEHLLSGSTSYATQAMEQAPIGLNERFFFALHHTPEKAEMLDGVGHGFRRMRQLFDEVIEALWPIHTIFRSRSSCRAASRDAMIVNSEQVNPTLRQISAQLKGTVRIVSPGIELTIYQPADLPGKTIIMAFMTVPL